MSYGGFLKAMMAYQSLAGGGGPGQNKSAGDFLNPFSHLKGMFGDKSASHPTLKGLGSLLGLFMLGKGK